jgi:hypothetical protein
MAQSLPKPFGFINTMSSTAAFYIARNLGIRGRNITVSSQRLSFERGLELLKLDFTGGAERSALISDDEAIALRGILRLAAEFDYLTSVTMDIPARPRLAV